MKTIIITISALFIIALALSAFVSKSTNDTEKQEYEVINELNEFQIRKYAPALYSSVQLSASTYKEVSGQGFRILAGYMFGGNEKEEKIAMTSPVTMEMKETSKMMFLVPSGWDKNNLPKPNNSSIYFEEYPERVVAAIEFGGWANDAKIRKYTEKLVSLLEENNIRYTDNFAYLGYNPPYDVVNRRNEVIVELEWPQ